MISKKIFYILSFFGLAFLFAWSRIHVIELGYGVSKLKGEVERIKRENGLLKSKTAGGISTTELLRYAEKFGMTPPGSDRILFIPEE